MRGEIVPARRSPTPSCPTTPTRRGGCHSFQGDDPMVMALNRIAQRDLEIQEYTDPRNDPRIPRTTVLEPGRMVFKIYNGYCDWVRPSTAELQRYEIRVDGEVAGFTAYHRGSRHIGVRRTEIDPGFEGQGLGSRLVADALDEARTPPQPGGARGPAADRRDSRMTPVRKVAAPASVRGELHGRRPAGSHPRTP